jgi:hypothetical protein
MSLAQVQFYVALVVTLIATWASLLIAVSLLMPAQTGRAEYALDTNPKGCLLKGIGTTLLFVFSIILISVPAPPIKFLGMILFSALLAIMTIGAAGIATLMGRRISDMSGARTSFGSLVRGSIAYSLALGFPYIGWMILGPVSTIFAFGAGISAIWPRRQSVAPPVPPVVPPMPTYENR